MQLLFTVRGKRANLMSYFLGEHPDQPYEKKTPHGVVRVKFTEYQEQLVKGYIGFYPDSVQLVQDSGLPKLEDYINDRAFVLSSLFLSQIRSSIGHVLSYNYANIRTVYEIELTLAPISTRMTDEEIVALYRPLGYDVELRSLQALSDFGGEAGQLREISIRTDSDITSVFRHLYVLLPVMDNYKHYRIRDDEVDKLKRYGEGWLQSHPERDRMIARYLRYHDEKIDRLRRELEISDVKLGARKSPADRLRTARYAAILDVIRQEQIREVVDMGAGEGNLLEYLVSEPTLQEIVACEPSERGRFSMRQRLSLWRGHGRVKVEPEIVQSSLLYHHVRLRRKGCIVLCEVIEHIEPDTLPYVAATLFEELRPQYIILTTPNRAYNPVFGLEHGVRHSDHKFEWSREELDQFLEAYAAPAGYTYTTKGVGPSHEIYGQPSLIAVLTRGQKS